MKKEVKQFLMLIIASTIIFSTMWYVEVKQEEKRIQIAEEKRIETARQTFKGDKNLVQGMVKTAFHYENILDKLPREVTVTNMLDEKVTLPVTYKINEKDLSDSDKVFDFLPKEVIEEMKSSTIDIEYNYGTRNSVIQMPIQFRNVEFKPIVLSIEEIESENFVNLPTSISVRGRGVEFEVSFPENFREKLRRINKPLSYIRVAEDISHVVPIIISDYNYPENYPNMLLSYDFKDYPHVMEGIKDGIEKLPMELLQFAVFSDLKVVKWNREVLTDDYFEKVQAKYPNEFSSKEQYTKGIAGTYSNSTVEIAFNVEQTSFLDINKMDFSKQFYTIDSSSSYIKSLHNTKKDSFTIKTKAKYYDYLRAETESTFFHEFGHFIDSSNSINSSFTEEEFNSYKNFIDYGYDNKYDSEIIAHAFSVYFENPEILKSKFPKLYEVVENEINNIKYSYVNDYKKFLDLYDNWNSK